MTIQSVMYAVYFEAQLHGDDNEPVGKIMQLSDPDIFPANSDKEAIKKAHERADLVEYLKSLKVRNRRGAKKLFVRVKTVIRKGAEHIIFKQGSTKKFKKK